MSFLVYFLPSIIVGIRKSQNGCVIIIVNLLLGWTLIGWLVALIWALADSPKRDITIQNYVPYPSPDNGPSTQRTCPKCGRRVGQTTDKCLHCGYNLSLRMKVCPYCREDILHTAIKCRYCQSDLPVVEPKVEQEWYDESSATSVASVTRPNRRSLWHSPPALDGSSAKPCPNPDCGNRFVSGDKCMHCGTTVST